MLKMNLTSKEIKETLRNGWYLFKHGKLVLAYDQFEKILNAKLTYIPPKIYAEAMFGIGLIFKERKRFREAKTCFKKAHEKNPRNIMYLREYGEACKEMKWYSEAIRAWERCLQFGKIDIRLLTKIAECYDLLGNFVMAKKYYHRAYRIDSENKYILLGLGNLYFHNQLYLDAIYYWEKLIYGKSFSSGGILLKLGYCFQKREEYEKALEYYKKAFSIDGENVYALYGLTTIYRSLGHKEEERTYYEKLLSIEPNLNKYKECYSDKFSEGRFAIFPVEDAEEVGLRKYE